MQIMKTKLAKLYTNLYAPLITIIDKS